MLAPRVHDLKRNGPVPIGALLCGFVNGSPLAYRCLGTMGDSPADSAFSRNGAGFDNSMIAVRASGVTTRVTLAKVLRPRGCTALSSSIENATSADVKG